MKKYWILIALSLMAVIVLLVGCGSESEEMETEETVTITIPRNMVIGQSEEEIIENAENEGMEAIVNDDSVQYTMTPETQQELLLAFKTHFEEDVQETLDESEVPGLLAVNYNEDMSAFDLRVNRAQFDEQDSEKKLELLFSAGTAYQLYAGKPEEEIDVIITLTDQENDEHYETISMRDTFTAQQTPGDDAD